MIVNSTTDYEQFNILDFNRVVKRSQLARLKKSIKECNLLHLHPIFVNKDMYILDGQHRLAAAKSLKLPVYYVITKDIPDSHVMRLNTTGSNWDFRGVINYFAEHDNDENYIKLKELTDATILRPRPLLQYLFGINAARISEVIRDGNFIIPEYDEDEVEKKLSLMRELDKFRVEYKFPLATFKGVSVCTALYNMFHHENFDSTKFISQMNRYWHLIRKQGNAKEWLKMFSSIYNKGISTNKVFDHGSEI